MSGSYTYAGTVLRVLDADTVQVDLDLGLRIHSAQAVRVAGIDAPELSTAAGKAAREFVQELLPVGSQVAVSTRKPDKYGRVLGSITYLGYGGTPHDLADKLVEAGHAQPYDGGKR